jgi:UDP-2,3-diacylglucosamine pyrophosphatase LpxH
MDIKAEVLMRNMPDDTSLETVEYELRKAAAEWLDLDHHPQDLVVRANTNVQLLARALRMMEAGVQQRPRQKGPVYAISDLHMGDAGPRDNFAYYGLREKYLMSFLDFVEENNGRLVICGDLFELWQSNISKVLTKRIWLLDRLAKMQAVYVLGNHDADLRYFLGQKGWLTHPFFERMCNGCHLNLGGKSFEFIHGHEADSYCASDTPGVGRITAIYSGLAEDRNGGPMLDKYNTVEQKVIGPLERMVSVWNWFRGKPDRFTEINRNLKDLLVSDVLVCGHTHRPGRIGDWHYNCGTWAEETNSFLCINQDGTVGVFDWKDNQPVPNNTELPI